jgi:hypothetical protein
MEQLRKVATGQSGKVPAKADHAIDAYVKVNRLEGRVRFQKPEFDAPGPCAIAIATAYAKSMTTMPSGDGRNAGG